MAQPWRATMFTYMMVYFCGYIQATNEMTYDIQQFYNNALAIVAGSAAAALSFRLLPPVSPAFRTCRLLGLTLRDLRRLAAGRVLWTANDWQGRIFGRLSALPDAAEPLQRAQLLAALAVGAEIIRLRRIGSSLGIGSAFDAGLEAVAQGNSANAAAQLSLVSTLLASFPATGTELEAFLALRARGSIFAISEALRQHASYFDAGDRA